MASIGVNTKAFMPVFFLREGFDLNKIQCLSLGFVELKSQISVYDDHVNDRCVCFPIHGEEPSGINNYPQWDLSLFPGVIGTFALDQNVHQE